MPPKPVNPWTSAGPDTPQARAQGKGIYDWLDYLSTSATLPSLASDAATGAFNLAKEARQATPMFPDVDTRLDKSEWETYRGADRDLPTAKRFRQEMATIYGTMPLRVSALTKQPVSLRQSVIDDTIAKEGDSKKVRARAEKTADYVLRILSGETQDGSAQPYIDRILTDVREGTPAFEGAQDEAFATLDQYEEWKRQARVDPNAPAARFRLTEGGQANWQRQRAYDFLRSLQEGEHAPPYAAPMTGPMQAAGAIGGIVTWPATAAAVNYGNLIDPALSQPFDQNKYFQGQADNARLLGNTLYGGVKGRMDSALYWLDRGKDATATKDPQTGANFPARSAALPAGYGDFFNNYGNLYTNLNSLAEVPARNFDLSGKQIAMLRNVRQDVSRDTPLIPDESFRKKASDALGNVAEHQSLQNQWLSANAPRAAYLANDTLGTNITPRYLAPYEALGAALPQEVFGDISSVFGLGKSFVTNLARNPVTAPLKAAKAVAKESVEESVPEYAMSIPEEAGLAGPEQVQPDLFTWFGTAPKYIGALATDNEPVAATNRPAYEKALAGYGQRRSDLVKSIDDYQRSSAWAKAVRDFKAGKDVPASKLKALRPTDMWTPLPTR